MNLHDGVLNGDFADTWFHHGERGPLTVAILGAVDLALHNLGYCHLFWTAGIRGADAR